MRLDPRVLQDAERVQALARVYLQERLYQLLAAAADALKDGVAEVVSHVSDVILQPLLVGVSLGVERVEPGEEDVDDDSEAPQVDHVGVRLPEDLDFGRAVGPRTAAGGQRVGSRRCA